MKFKIKLAADLGKEDVEEIVMENEKSRRF
jgi:hypothetical protein